MRPRMASHVLVVFIHDLITFPRAANRALSHIIYAAMGSSQSRKVAL